MSEQFKSLAALSGFSKVLGNDASQFILLDRDTDGTAGRPIYIKGALASKFTGLTTTNANTVFAKIKQLRATAGGVGAYSNANNVLEHMTVVGSVGVRYKMVQSTGSPKRKPGVYITDLDVGNFADGDPGLYKVVKGRDRWSIGKEPIENIKTDFAAINGLCKNLQHAAVELLPDMFDSVYDGDDVAGKGYTLCYNPPSLYHRDMLWRSPTQKKTNKHVVAMHLKEALLDAQSRKQKVQWVVHSDGAHVLHDALNLVGGRDLSCHTMIFLAPTKDVSTVLPLVRKTKINLHSDVMRVQDDDWRSRKTQMGSGKRLKQELNQMPGFSDRAELLRKQANRDRHSVVSNVVKGATLTAAIGSFFLSPVVTAAAVAGVAWQAYGAVQNDQHQSVRNKMASNTKNHGLNPHFHPSKTKDEMNLHAKKHSGSVAKTFRDLVRELAKG